MDSIKHGFSANVRVQKPIARKDYIEIDRDVAEEGQGRTDKSQEK